MQIDHKPLRTVRVVGRLAEKEAQEGRLMRGVLVAPLPPQQQQGAAAAATATAAEQAGGAYLLSTSQ